MIDVVIPLGNGSTHNDEELRYALRSIDQYLKGYRDIVIVGRVPDWVTGVRHIPIPDHSRNVFRERNIMLKTLAACDVVSDTFLFTNDDIFLTESIKADEMPYHHKGKLSECLKYCTRQNPYRYTLSNTVSAFFKNGTGDFDSYDTHAPMLMDRRKFPEAMSRYNWNRSRGYCMKTLYAQYAGISGEFYPDCKINEPLSKDEYLNIASVRPYFSFGDKAICPEFWQAMNILYPKRSRYEQ